MAARLNGDMMKMMMGPTNLALPPPPTLHAPVAMRRGNDKDEDSTDAAKLLLMLSKSN